MDKSFQILQPLGGLQEERQLGECWIPVGTMLLCRLLTQSLCLLAPQLNSLSQFKRSSFISDCAHLQVPPFAHPQAG